MKNKEKIIISTMLCVCVLFFISPALMRISFIRDGISWYFEGLGNSNFKSSYMSSIGVAVGTIMTIIGTLFIQKMLDKNYKKQSELKKKQKIENALKIVYYDLKMSFEKILFMETVIQAGNSIEEEYIEIIRNTKFYLDSNWREKIFLLDEVLKKETIEKIIETYYMLYNIEYEVQTTQKDIGIQMIILASHIGEFCDTKVEDIKEEYKELLKEISMVGNIEQYIL